jgi:hypothetical protein
VRDLPGEVCRYLLIPVFAAYACIDIRHGVPPSIVLFYVLGMGSMYYIGRMDGIRWVMRKLENHSSEKHEP